MSAAFINQLALVYDIKQIIYFVTPNWDFTYYLFGGTPLFDGLTVLFSLAICLIYLLIMIVVSCVVFKRRDIKNILEQVWQMLERNRDIMYNVKNKLNINFFVDFILFGTLL